MPEHLSPEYVGRYLQRSLTRDERTAADAHLASCDVCQRQIVESPDLQAAFFELQSDLTAHGEITLSHLTFEQMESNRPALSGSVSLHLLCWVLGAGETWLIFRLMHAPVALAPALAIDSLVGAIRTASFFVPGAIGTQEGGYVLLCGLFGLSPATALAFSLARRGRDIDRASTRGALDKCRAHVSGWIRRDVHHIRGFIHVKCARHQVGLRHHLGQRYAVHKHHFCAPGDGGEAA